MRHKPVDGSAAMAQGVDVLLRRFRGLDTKMAASAAGPVRGSTGGGSYVPTYLVAAYSARPELKSIADFVCSGDDDQVELQAAIDLIEDSPFGRGTVVTTAGYFNCSDRFQATTPGTEVRLVGQGIRSTAISSQSAPASMRDGLISMGDMCSIEDMTVDASHANYRYAISVTGTNPLQAAPTFINRVYARLGTGATDGWGAMELYDQVIVDLCVVSSLANGIYLFNDDAQVLRSVFTATGTQNGADGAAIHLGATGSVHHRAEGNFILAACDLGILAEGADECFILNNYSESLINLKTGSDRHVVVGNYADVTIDAGASDNVVDNNYGTLTDNGTDTKVGAYLDDIDGSPLTTKGDLHSFSTVDAALAIGTDEQILTVDAAETTGIKWADNVKEQAFSQDGAISTGTGTTRWYTLSAKTIISVHASVGVTSSSGVVTVDVNKDGTTIFTTTTNRPEIAAAAYVSASETPDVTVFASGSYLTVDVDAAGTDVEDLVVVIRYREA